MKHIVIVDDEKNIRELIKKYMVKEGYQVTLFENADKVLDELDSLNPNLFIIDIMLPGVDGLELCKQIRKKSDVPIIFVTAKDEELDRILGLELGADDYLTKPFSPRELVVRAKNLFKRLEKGTELIKDLQIKDIKVCFAKRLVKKNGLEIKFTTKEYDLFAFLTKNKNIPFTREQILEKVWGYESLGDERLVDDLIKRIRKKFKDAGSVIEIVTIWGYGYRLDG